MGVAVCERGGKMIPKFRFYSERMNKIGIVISLHPLRKRVYVEWDDTLSGTEDINDNGILMQSTGLFDNSTPKKEIFEHSELDGAYEVIFKDLRYSLRHIQNNDIIDLYDYWRCKNGEIEVTREYTKV